MGLLYCLVGSFCGLKLFDVQVVYEIVNSLNMGFLVGVNFMLYLCGWFEGGFVVDFEKFVMDVDQFGVLYKMVKGIDMSENG